MNTENQIPIPAPVSPVELVQRQLQDWQSLRTELKARYKTKPTDEDFRHIAYCEDMIDSLAEKLKNLL